MPFQEHHVFMAVMAAVVVYSLWKVYEQQHSSLARNRPPPLDAYAIQQQRWGPKHKKPGPPVLRGSQRELMRRPAGRVQFKEARSRFLPTDSQQHLPLRAFPGQQNSGVQEPRAEPKYNLKDPRYTMPFRKRKF